MAEAKKTTIWSRNFICLMIANSLQVMSHSSVSALVSTYAVHLGAGPKLMGLLTGLFFGIALALRPVAGPVTTRADHRKLLMFVYVLGIVSNIGYAIFHSIPAFMFFRVLHGVQYAFLGSLLMTIAADSLPTEKLASGLGVFGIGTSIATSIAPQVGLALRDWGIARAGMDLGYTLVFSFSALMMLGALIPTMLLRTPPRTPEAHSDRPWYMDIFSGPALLPSFVMMFISMGYCLFNSFMVPFGAERSIENIGIYFTLVAILLLAFRPMCGHFADKYGTRAMVYPGTVFLCSSFLVIAGSHGLTQVLVGGVLAALGYGSLYPSVQSLTLQMEPRARRAVASNTMYAGVDLGQFLGPLLGGMVLDSQGSYAMVIRSGVVYVLLACVIFTIGARACMRRLAVTKQEP